MELGADLVGFGSADAAAPRHRQDPGRRAAAGACLDDLAAIAVYALQQWRSRPPDPDEDGFEDRWVQVGTTFGGAGVIRGDLTPECAAAVQAVLEEPGKRHGPEDTRSEGQRLHDALQRGCPPLPRARPKE